MNNAAPTDVIVELSVPDFGLAKTFYRNLGFEVVWEEPANKMNGYLVMKREKSVLCFFCGNDFVYNHPFFTQFPRDTKRGYGVEISIPVEHIDAVFEKIKAKLKPEHLFQPLRMQPWGKKDFRVVDPLATSCGLMSHGMFSNTYHWKRITDSPIEDVRYDK